MVTATQTHRPRLTNAMIRAYAVANPNKAWLAEIALRGCRNSRAEIAYEIGARA